MKYLLLTLNSFADSWWEWIVVSTAQGFLLLAVVSLVLCFWKSLQSSLRYGFLLLVLLKLAVPPVFGSSYSFSDLLSRGPTLYITPLVLGQSQLADEVAAAPTFSYPFAFGKGEVLTSEDFVLTPFAWLLLIQVFGALFVLNLVEREWRSTKRLLRRSVEVVGPLKEQLHRVAFAVRLRRPPRLYLSSSVSAPQTGGIVRPFVLLPLWVATMPDDELEILLAHELAHVRRMDAFVNRLQALVQAWLWWNPAVWWLNRRIREEREFCCDDSVLALGIASGADYSRTLLTVAERVSLPKSAWSASGMADNFVAIDCRVRRALAGGQVRSGFGRYVAPVLFLLVACWVLPGATDGVDEVERVFDPEAVKRIESEFKIFDIRSDSVGLNDDGVPVRSGDITFTLGPHDEGNMEITVEASGELRYFSEHAELRGTVNLKSLSDSIETSGLTIDGSGYVIFNKGVFKSDGRIREEFNSPFYIDLRSPEIQPEPVKLEITSTVVWHTVKRPPLPGPVDIWNKFLDFFEY